MTSYHPLLKPFTQLESGYFPTEELKAVIAEREVATPLLLQALEDYVADPSEGDENLRNYLPLVATTLLAQFREPNAFEPLLALFKKYRGDIHQYSLFVYGLDRGASAQILASVCQGRIDALKALVADSHVDDTARSIILGALLICYVEGDMDRPALTCLLSRLLRDIGQDDTELATALFDTCMLIHPRELMDDIRQFCRSGVIYADYALAEDYNQVAYDPSEPLIDCIEEGVRENRLCYISDAIEVLDFSELNQVCDHYQNAGVGIQGHGLFEGVDPNEFFGGMIADEPGYLADTQETFIRDTPKTGRNDPCPCGSGKKFKKCCG